MSNQDSTQNVPALRLDGSNGKWVSKPINSVAEIHNGRDYKHLKQGPIPVYGTGGYMRSVNEALSYSHDAVGIGRKGTINKPYILKAPFWTVDTLFYVTPRNNTDLHFLHASMIQVDWLSKNTATGLPSLTGSAVMSTEVIFPPTLEEQRAIGAVFTKLDAAIDQHTKKHRVLQHTKTALMQKMFPQDGQTEPELRLDGFEGGWDSRPINSVAEIHNGRDYKHLKQGPIPVYGTGGYMRSVNEALSYSHDAVGIGRKGTINKPYILKAPFWTVDTLFYVTPRNNTDLHFLHASMIQVDWLSKNTATGLPSLTGSAVMSTEVIFPPTLEEQRAIGAVFTKLDTLISAEAQLIEKLKQTKTALLQKMFV